MTSLTLLAPLLAQLHLWRRLGDRFSGEHVEWQTADTLGLAAVGGAFVVGFWFLSWLSAWQQTTTETRSPRRLFRELAAAHRLNYRARRTCREVAQAAQLKEPAELFLRPDLRVELEERDRTIAERLFGAAE